MKQKTESFHHFDRTLGERIRPLAAFLVLAFGVGCATCPERDASTRAALRSIPEVDEAPLRADQALVSAFFAASGIHLTTSQLAAIIPLSSPEGQLDRQATRRIAEQHHRRLRVVKADEQFLWDELAQNRPLLVLLPPDFRYSPAATPLIPVAWDRQQSTLDLLDGHGQIQAIPADSFFGRREPLKQAALCLVKSGGLSRAEPSRDHKLLFADFGFDERSYRRDEVAYTAIQQVDSIGEADLDVLLDRGHDMIRKGRHQEAVPVFQTALILEPDNPKILNNLAFTMLKGNGELMTALRHATKAAQLDPDNPLVLETLGSINLRLGDAPTAANYLQQAWARALRRSPEVQIAIMDQLVRAELAADHQDLALQIAEYRHRTFPNYRIPKDILSNFPALRRARILSGQNIVQEGG
jgi:tetratricopeptide (TPR) repeat protein